MIIGFHGVKGSGKDTAAQYLIDNYGFQKIAFADKLKEAVANLFNVPIEKVDEWKEDREYEIPLTEVNLDIGGTVEYTYSWREFLQRFGTEMGRDTFGKDFWVNQWEDSLYKLSDFPDELNIVVTDVRFQNECHTIHRLDGIVFRIVRPGYSSDGHASEMRLPDIIMDGEIENSGTIEELHKDVETIYQETLQHAV